VKGLLTFLFAWVLCLKVFAFAPTATHPSGVFKEFPPARFTYDRNGNLLSDDNRVFSYDARN
jgi:hypothetical protein